MSLEERLGKFGNWLDKKADQATELAGHVADEVTTKAAKLVGFVEQEAELRSLTADDIVERVNAYQNSSIAHPLTCGVDSNHDNLEPVKTVPDNRVVLICPTCKQVQTNIPREVLLAYSMLQEAQKAMEKDYDDESDLGK